MEPVEGEGSKGGNENTQRRRKAEPHREQRKCARRIAVERCVDDSEVAALGRRGVSVPGGIRIGDDTEVTVDVPQRPVLSKQEHQREADVSKEPVQA